MPIQTLEKRKRQKNLIFVLLAVVLVTAVVLYFGFWKKTPTSITEEIPGTASTAIPGISAVTEEKLKKINLDFNFLNEKIIPFLKIHGKIPVRVEDGEIGRDNPFIPY